MKLSIRAKIVLITLVILFLTIGVNTLISSSVFMREYSDSLQSETFVIGQGLALQLDRLLRLGIPVEEIVGFEKQCQEIVNKYEEISYAMVVDTDGKILFHNDPSRHGQVLSDSAMLKAVKGAEDVIQVYSHQGEKYYDVTIPAFDIHGMHTAAVKIGFPAKLIAQKTRGLVTYSVMVAFVSLGLATALLVFTLSAWVTSPLMRLLTVIQEIRREGTHSAKRVEIDSKDEIGQLGFAFNQMISDLEESHEKIREYADELERRVEERTAQLSKANALLKQEIAERKAAEEALRVSEERFALAVQGANDGIWDWDIANNSLYWSPRMKEMLGYVDDELNVDFDTFDSLLHPDDREHTAAAIEAHLKDRGLYDVEQRLRTKSGEYRWFRARGQALWDETGNPVRMAGSTTDITERKRAETEIRRLNQFLDSVINTANVWLDVIDKKGNVMLRNRAAEEISGYSREEVIGHAKIWEWIYPDEEYRNEVLARAIARIGTGEEAKDVETTIRRKDGQTRVISWNSRNLVDEEGNPIGSIALGHDITERKRAEEALRGEKALMDALMDNIPDSIYFKDRQGRLIRINRKMMRDLNLDEMSQAVGKTDVDLFGEEFGRKTLAEDQRIMATGEPIIGLIESRQLEDGQINWTLTTKVPLRDTSGQIMGLVGITHEINEFMRAEDELRQLKEFNEGIVQGMEEGIVMEDAEGYITFVNPKMAEMLGYTEEELTGKHWSETVAPSCLRQVEEQSSKRLDGISSRYEAVLLRKDGKEVPGLVSARPLFREGEFAGTLAVCTDLTERKEMEQQLIQAGKLAAMGQLVAGVAHELNNPLTSVVGYSQLLMGAECSEETKRDLERINRQAVRAAKIVENLLTFARRREPRKESININDVIEKSLELQAHQLELDGISIVKELDEALPPTMADPFQMQQVFMNLISNAHQALRDWEGERKLRVRSELAGDMIHLQFTDSGPGIPAEVMGRLFEPFFTTREVGEGTGLGLSIAYGIVEAHSGRIWAENEVGKGATFIVEIPVKGN